MPSFVSTLIDNISSTSVNFLSTVVSTYWGTMLGISLVAIIGGMFWRFAKFGHK